LKGKDIPLKTAIDFPEKVGIDRLLAAYAAICWKRKKLPGKGHKPMLVCDLGTAITIDLISPDDVFLGGAILPGMNLATKSLHRGTVQLPKANLFTGNDSFVISPFPGKNTADAIRTGIFEGIVGTIRRFYKITNDLMNVKPLLLLTGGDSELIYFEIQRELPVFFLPQLVLNGIYLVVSSQKPDFTLKRN
jgi:type III pantothenate kinase